MREVIAGLEIPETAAVAEATRRIQETTSPLIYHHSRRVFFFSLIHAHKLGVKPDPELLYLAAMFHDTGLLTPFSDVEQRFEVDGADHARKFLLDRGFSTPPPRPFGRRSRCTPRRASPTGWPRKSRPRTSVS
ncbi:HD domain-containing protein [Micromonospora sp. ATA51]|uniref:HD domain-containing protein n=1 Tax=Micromonospora sp. ATA51 TaxID=2806098 RepID=UPI001EE4304D|nr:HD domain-containing protein [Micromonospora sp. ATA51]